MATGRLPDGACPASPAWVTPRCGSGNLGNAMDCDPYRQPPADERSCFRRTQGALQPNTGNRLDQQGHAQQSQPPDRRISHTGGRPDRGYPAGFAWPAARHCPLSTRRMINPCMFVRRQPRGEYARMPRSGLWSVAHQLAYEVRITRRRTVAWCSVLRRLVRWRERRR